MMGADNNKIRADGIVKFFGINKNSVKVNSMYTNKEGQLVIPLIGKSPGDELLINAETNKVGLKRGLLGLFKSDIGLSFFGNNPKGSITDKNIINKIRNAISVTK